jgi:hypothetical protein
LELFLDINPNNVSIEVAPAIEIEPKEKLFESRGINIIARSSLITFEVKDIAPKVGEYRFEIITPEREYHPNPAEAPMLSKNDKFVKKEDNPPKSNEPIMVNIL